MAMMAILEVSKIGIILSNDDIYRFIITISTGESKYEQIVDWLKQNTDAL